MSDPESVIDGPWIHADDDLDSPRTGRFLLGNAACFTHRSPDPDKERNEDAVAIVPTGAHAGILVIADGLGGQPRGDDAARAIVETMADVAAAPEESLREAILHAIDQANSRIQEAGHGGGATLAVLEIEDHYVRPYHIGDAFIIVMGQRGRIKYQNIPHSPVGYAVESGLMNEIDAVHHHERNLVSNFVGTTDMYIDIGPRIKLAPRDTVLIASDGLSDNLYVEEIINAVRTGSLESAAARLQDKTLGRMTADGTDLPSHADDLSFCLFRLDPKNAARQLNMVF